jgi:FlaA1/EpsC-like NDP-sugar epimerase
MTPPPVATDAAPRSNLQLQEAPAHVASTSLASFLSARTWARIRFLMDALVLSLAASAALFPAASLRSVSSNYLLAALFPLLVLTILHARRSPDDRLNGSLLDSAANVLGVVSMSAMLFIAVDAIIGTAHPLGLALRLWMFSVVYLVIARCVLLSVRRQASRSEALATPTLIVGAGTVGEQLYARLRSDSRYGLRPVGFLDNNPLPRANGTRQSPVLGGREDLAEAVEHTGARQVILAFSTEPDMVLVETVKECQRLGVDVALVPRLYEAINERSTLDHVGGLPLVALHPTDSRPYCSVSPSR